MGGGSELGGDGGRRRSRSGWCLVSLSVDVASAVDVHDLYAACVFDDGVDDPVVTSTRRVQACQFISEGFADPARVLGERAEDELDTGRRDLLRQPLEVAVSASGDLNLVRLAHTSLSRIGL